MFSVSHSLSFNHIFHIYIYVYNMKICAVHGCCITIYIYSKYHLARDSSMSYISIYIYWNVWHARISYIYIYILCRKNHGCFCSSFHRGYATAGIECPDLIEAVADESVGKVATFAPQEPKNQGFWRVGWWPCNAGGSFSYNSCIYIIYNI
jgi:hypothetical protein